MIRIIISENVDNHHVYGRPLIILCDTNHLEDQCIPCILAYLIKCQLCWTPKIFLTFDSKFSYTFDSISKEIHCMYPTCWNTHWLETETNALCHTPLDWHSLHKPWVHWSELLIDRCTDRRVQPKVLSPCCTVDNDLMVSLLTGEQLVLWWGPWSRTWRLGWYIPLLWWLETIPDWHSSHRCDTNDKRIRQPYNLHANTRIFDIDQQWTHR